ncbi:MAG: hypothetical protein LBI35_07365 [Burkholderiales bacterium]|nr:hypothetical protein [Burkholderiales bacterium]
MRVDVSHNIDEVLRKFEALPAKQIPYALSVALNRTTNRIWSDWKNRINTVFDRPTPFTQKSPLYKNSTKKDLTATVWIRDVVGGKGNAPAEYLHPQTPQNQSGSRPHKRMENALRYYGLMRPGEFAVPAGGAQLDQYGNIPRGEIVKIMSWLGIFGEQGYSANKNVWEVRKAARTGIKLKKQGYGYFVVRHRDPRERHLARGIWRREGLHGVKLVPVFLFVRSVNYKPIFDPIGVGQKIVKDELPIEADRAIREALETMR